MIYDSIIIGGGIAGLQAAIQLGRYEHKVLVIDAGYGRSTLCRSYHNVLGWPDGVSGEDLRRLGKLQAERTGVQFVTDEVQQLSRNGGHFRVRGKSAAEHEAFTLLIATGVLDRFPEVPGLKPCLGLTVFVCPDCDGYEVKDKRTVVLGAGEVGANMALTLTHWTKQLVYVNHDQTEVKPETMSKIQEQGIGYRAEKIQEVLVQGDGRFQGVRLQNGETLQGDRGFIAFGGNAVKSDLVSHLGVERFENKHILTDPRSKMTNVPGVFAAGDIGVHSEQVTIAMGEGQQAAIWMHKSIMQMKEKLKEKEKDKAAALGRI